MRKNPRTSSQPSLPPAREEEARKDVDVGDEEADAKGSLTRGEEEEENSSVSAELSCLSRAPDSRGSHSWRQSGSHFAKRYARETTVRCRLGNIRAPA